MSFSRAARCRRGWCGESSHRDLTVHWAQGWRRSLQKAYATCGRLGPSSPLCLGGAVPPGAVPETQTQQQSVYLGSSRYTITAGTEEREAANRACYQIRHLCGQVELNPAGKQGEMV